MRPRRSYLITYRVSTGQFWQYAAPRAIMTRWEAMDIARNLARSLGKEAQVYVNGILV